jgi:hypothetical protein
MTERYRAVCDCGDASSWVPTEVVARSWAEEHRDTEIEVRENE